jgi:type II secretory pathway predicted ATPase ExeA
MNKEILSYFNLSAQPFSKEIPTDDFMDFPSASFIYQSLQALINTKGIGVLTGKPGAGKSCLIRKLFANLNAGLYKPLYICHSSVSVIEFYLHLAVALGLEPAGRKAQIFRVIKERILGLNKSSRIHPVLVIDEAHLLKNEVLQELRLLLNFEIDSFDAMTIILCGQPSLEHKFSLSMLESIANSITFSLCLEGLKEEETYSYLESRILKVGNSNPVFTKNAMRLIHQASSGILRSVNNIANASLIKAFQMKAQSIEAEHVNLVISR